VHWSLIRKRSHYPSDVIAGGALGIAVAMVMWKLWPPEHSAHEEAPLVPAGVGGERPGGRSELPADGAGNASQPPTSFGAPQ
jgi:hypothetical protein